MGGIELLESHRRRQPPAQKLRRPVADAPSASSPPARRTETRPCRHRAGQPAGPPPPAVPKTHSLRSQERPSTSHRFRILLQPYPRDSASTTKLPRSPKCPSSRSPRRGKPSRSRVASRHWTRKQPTGRRPCSRRTGSVRSALPAPRTP